MAEERFHLVFTDLRMPDTDGIAVLEYVRKLSEDTEVIVITGYGSIDSAIEAMKKGAYHYSIKPLKLDEIRMLAKNAAEKIRLRLENRCLRDAIARRDSPTNIIGTSPVMQEVFAMIRKVADVDCNLLIQGKSGTGKELVARAVHSLSPRKNSPFVSFNCGGFTEELISSELFGHEKGAFTGATATKIGLIESGAGGTVFLDEIGEMPLSMQVKLLHVIQEKRIFRVGGIKPIDLDIRIIAATNRDRKKKQKPGISQPASEILLHYDFPGNVRELKNIIERAVALTDHDRIQVSDLPPDIRKLEFQTVEKDNFETLEEMEKRYISKVLERTNYNKNLAAQILGLPRTTLWRRLREYGFSV